MDEQTTLDHIIQNRAALLAELRRRQAVVRDYVRGVARQYATRLYLFGRPGTAKTPTVRAVLEGEIKEIYAYQRGHLTPMGLFELIAEHPDEVVDDGGTVIASGLTGVSSVKLALTGSADVVSVDLGGNALSGNLTANLGTTATTLTVADGSISGRLTVSGQVSADAVTVGGTGTTLTVADDSPVNLGSQAGNSLTVLSGVTFSDDLFVSAASVTIDGTVGGNLDVNSAYGGGGCGTSGFGSFAGFGKRPSFAGFGRFAGPMGHGEHGSSSVSTSLTLGSTGSVGGNLDYSAGGTSDSVDIAGKVGGSVEVKMPGSNETATLESSATIGTRADFTFGNGADTITVAGTIGASGNKGTQDGSANP